MSLPRDLTLRPPHASDIPAIAALVGACDGTYRDWAPAGWEPPPPGRELDRWRGRLTDGSCWTRVAAEPAGRLVGLVCFTQAVVQPVAPAPPTAPAAGDRPPAVGVPAPEPIAGRAHIAALFTHPDRWREGIAAALLAAAEAAMREEGYREAQLWTPERAPARRFYEATGWAQDGRTQWAADIALSLVAYVKRL